MAYRDRPAEADDQTSRQPTLADVLADPTFERVTVSARWSEQARAIVVKVRAERGLTSEEHARLVAVIRANGQEAASKVFEDFETTLDQPLTFVGVETIGASAIDIIIEPENRRRAD